MSGAAAIVLAAGAGRRLGADVPKAFLPIGSRTMLRRSVEAALAAPEVDLAVVAVPPGWEDRAAPQAGRGKAVAVVGGGETRQESVRLALRAVPEAVEVVACHDAARPFASPALFGAVIEAVGDGAVGAVPVVPLADTIKRARDGWVVGTEGREELAAAQTPQAFAVRALREAHERAAAQGLAFTDDAAVVEWAGGRVRTVPGEPGNLKVTTPEDLARAEAVVGSGSPRMPRVGVGFDIHPREDGKPLLLGGVEFAGEPGLGGHSDADVICHALADAMLGAATLGDLGEHFPDTDPAHTGIGGLDLLARVVRLVAGEGLRVASCDMTFVGERPALGPRRDEIRGALAVTLGLDPGRVSVKATRPEGLGLSGDGAACLAVAVLEPA